MSALIWGETGGGEEGRGRKHLVFLCFPAHNNSAHLCFEDGELKLGIRNVLRTIQTGHQGAQGGLKTLRKGP